MIYDRWFLLAVMSLAVVAAPAALGQTGKSKASPAKNAATDTKPKDAKKASPPRSPSEEVPPPSAAAEAQSPSPTQDEAALKDEKTNTSRLLLASGISIFVLAVFVGFEVISKVPATLHTPLMSGSNAISGITVVGAIIAAASGWGFASFLGFFAVILAMVNVVGGFLVTHRMLLMFKRK